MDAVKEIMAHVYGIYNAFLAPRIPVRAQHRPPAPQQPRHSDDQVQRSGLGRDRLPPGSDVPLRERPKRGLQADGYYSVPKFFRKPKYEQQLRNYEVDLGG
ncbi:hypothetical protein IWW34DRAFT_856828 [Fusarium oxysporum f. sp. albedinis]|uniref:Uncharacterized protein n=1 Tax=Fusarium oxysporum f. sp. narcissi TaxID=451672 RepID=A0A4Q2V8B5_FUSOX|nr:hypothetical protein IWW34DRAFT_856828 [Fusarium oxysporum f. sp. albedinis]RKL10091.1 hypothetical protein BFJ70_g16588 [Fusarium oxysporum]RYC80423.1 hypothetical protein BFJ63_vAg16699 [Fusarium oxysporum f. sp. narcissi]